MNVMVKYISNAAVSIRNFFNKVRSVLEELTHRSLSTKQNQLGVDETRLYKRCERFSIFYFPVLLFFLYAFSIKQTGQTGDCPVAIDLNGNGRIDITGFTTTQDKLYTLFATGHFVEFDVWGDGGMQRIDWIKGNTDALIVEWDRENPKTTITGRELMGPIRIYEDGRDEWFADGYAKMASFDTDGNGQLSGDELSTLALWIDDGDAILENGEIESFESRDIVSVSVQSNRVRSYYGFSALQSEAITREGSILTEDIWFLNEEAIQPHDLYMAKILSFLGI